MIDSIRPLPPATRYVLRGSADVMVAAGSALQLDLSQKICQASTSNQWAALSLGPDEQLLLGPESAAVESASLLEQALKHMPHSLVDVSHRQVAIEVSGPHARAILNTGCPLDLDAFVVGTCTRTMLGKAEIVLWHRREEVFQVEVWRSFSGYVTQFLRMLIRV